MVFKVKLILVTLFVFVFFIYLEYVAAKEKTCKSLTSDMTKRQLAQMNNCTKALKFKSGKDKGKRASCIVKCVLHNINILNSNYKVDTETLVAFAERELPAGEIYDRAMTELKGCAEAHGEELDPDEELCKSYDGIVRCIIMGVTRVCP